MLIGIRGAITVKENRSEAIQEAAARLFSEIVERNGLERGNVVTAFFTSTPDLDMAFPATAARILGWSDVPFLGAQELAVDGALRRCIRILVLANLDDGHRADHVYMEGAATLRPDLVDDTEPKPSDAGERRRVAIIGLGLIGGSIAAALPSDRWEVWGVDCDATTIGSANAASSPERVLDMAELEAVPELDLVVLATPIPSILTLLERWSEDGVPGGAVVTDVGSVKGSVVRAMSHLPPDVEWVGGHPIAGTEHAGFEARDPSLFHGAKWVLTSEGAGESGRRTVEDLVASVGSRVVTVDAADHDRILARTSHLPFLVAGAMAREAEALDADCIADLVGPGFRDATRLAGQGAEMSLAFTLDNREEIARAARSVSADLDAVVRALESGEAARVRDVLERGASARIAVVDGESER